MNNRYLIIGAIILIVVIGGVLIYNSMQEQIPSEYTQKPTINSEADAQNVINDIEISVDDSLGILGNLKDSLE